MSKTNLRLFEELPEHEYCTSNQVAASFFNGTDLFPNIFGFDEKTGGFVAIHRSHSATGLEHELPVCSILKRSGFGILLLEEAGEFSRPDAVIKDKLFEIKRIADAKNLRRAVIFQFRTAYRKSNNLLLHIDQPVNFESLRSAIFAAAFLYPKIQLVWVVVNLQLFQFERQLILKGKHQFK